MSVNEHCLLQQAVCAHPAISSKAVSSISLPYCGLMKAVMANKNEPKSILPVSSGSMADVSELISSSVGTYLVQQACDSVTARTVGRIAIRRVTQISTIYNS